MKNYYPNISYSAVRASYYYAKKEYTCQAMV